MEYIFLSLFVLSGPLLVLGLIFPNFLQRLYKRTLTRKQNLLIYGLLWFVSVVGFGMTAPEVPIANTAAVEVVNITDTKVGIFDEENIVSDSELLKEYSSTEQGIETINKVSDSDSQNEAETYLVTRVVDGDTIDVLIDGENKRVRYIGVNTPETVHPSKPVECFGAEASSKNKELVAGKQVRLVKDVSETDKYGRLLRYVYVDDIFVNLTLVKEGYANVSTYPPDVAYNDVFLSAEQEARKLGTGLWGEGCENESVSEVAPVVSPVVPVVQSSSGSQCVVKGNINSDEVKIYHVPGCQSYNQTRINEEAGERWFCSEQEALEAGWRKALNC